jgi:dihydroorotate dehydrogenase
LVYEGPGLIGAMKRELTAAVRRAGARNVSELTGRRSREWAAKAIEV